MRCLPIFPGVHCYLPKISPALHIYPIFFQASSLYLKDVAMPASGLFLCKGFQNRIGKNKHNDFFKIFLARSAEWCTSNLTPQPVPLL